MRGSRKIGTVVAGGLLGVVALTGTVAAASITTQPAEVAAGQRVTVSGDVLAGGQPGCETGDAVTLLSPAFAGHGEFAGVPAITATVSAGGTFATAVRVASSVAPGTYSISGRCGGGNLGVTANLTVTAASGAGSLAPTGADLAGHGAGEVALGATGLVLLGAAGVIAASSRRRRATT